MKRLAMCAIFCGLCLTSAAAQNSPRIQNMKERLDRRSQTVSAWETEAQQQVALSIAIGVFGLLVGLMQGAKKNWIKYATAAVGFTVSALTLVSNKAYPADYRAMTVAARQARPILEDLSEIVKNFDPSQTPENQVEIEADFKSKCAKIDLIEQRLLGSDSGVQSASLEKSGWLFSPPVVHAQSPAQQSAIRSAPVWAANVQQADKLSMYFIGSAQDKSLSSARSVALEDAVQKAASELVHANGPQQSGSQVTPQLLDLVRHSSDVVDTSFSFDKATGTYRYYTRLRLSNDFRTLDLKPLLKANPQVAPASKAAVQKQVHH